MRRALVTVAVMAAGCGGDDTLTKEKYAARLDAACREFAERERRIGDPQTAADFIRFGPAIVEAFEETILQRVESVDPPEEVAGEAAQMRQLAHDQRDVLPRSSTRRASVTSRDSAGSRLRTVRSTSRRGRSRAASAQTAARERAINPSPRFADKAPHGPVAISVAAARHPARRGGPSVDG
jgi:DNA-binding response OmpR family regulator